MRIIASSRFPLFIYLLLIAITGHTENKLLADHPLAGKIWDMNSRSFIDESVLIARIDRANVVLLMETHGNPLHHDIQLRLLKARIASGARPALLMEQLDSESQAALDAALVNSNKDEALSAATRLIKFTDWKSYLPFLATAIDYDLPVIAANIPSRQLQPVIWYGFSAYDAAALKHMQVEEVWSDSRENYMQRHIGAPIAARSGIPCVQG